MQGWMAAWRMWKPCTWLCCFYVQTGNGFKECLCSSGSLFFELGSLPPGHILKVPCQFLDACSHGLSPGCPPNSPSPSLQWCNQHKGPCWHISLCTLTVVFHPNGREEELKPKAKKKKKINTDVGSLKTWYLVHHEFFLHFYFKVLTLKYHLDY